MTTARKPRIALMGEFSAGKSTLTNLLLGSRPLPEKVTATRLSPVWMAQGESAPYRIDVNGEESPVSVDHLEGLPVEETRVIRLFFQADVLEVCDLIDFPGISDPNMSSEVWQRMLEEVDAVIWCTHATQAWRQSEAAVWETIPEEVRKRSMLLITRFDKLTNERDRYRVMARLQKETEGQFAGLFPISLTEALAAGEDQAAFDASGGGAFLQHFVPMVQDLAETVMTMDRSIYQVAMGEAPIVTDTKPVETVEEIEAPAPIDFAARLQQPAARTEIAAENTPVETVTSSQPVVSVDSAQPVIDVSEGETLSESAVRVLPRRVRPTSAGRTARPPREKGPALDIVDPSEEFVAPRPQAAAEDLRSIFN